MINLNRNQIVGQLGPDGKPIGLLDAMMGVRPIMNPNPFNVPSPSQINYSDLTRELAEKPVANNLAGSQNFNLMNTFRNMFDMPTTTSSIVDGQKITETVMPNVNNVTDIAGKAATSGANPLMFMSALSGLLEQNQPPPMQVMPMQQAVRGNPIQVADLSRFYGGIL